MKKRIIISAVLVLLASLALAQVQIDMDISPKGTLFTFANMFPGDFISRKINLTNIGNADITRIEVSTEFDNSCVGNEPNNFCLSNSNLTDVLNCSLLFNGSVVRSTVTNLKDGIFMEGGLKIGETKELDITILFDAGAGSEYQATSAIVSFSFTAVKPKIVINEIMYDPPEEEPDNEWVELYDLGDTYLENWSIENSAGDAYTFSGEIDKYLVLACNKTAFEEKYPNVDKSIVISLNCNSEGEWLHNDGDTVTLRETSGKIVDSVTYNRSWGGIDGYSLERIDPLGDSNDPNNWASSLILGGTPGAVNSVVPKPSPGGGGGGGVLLNTGRVISTPTTPVPTAVPTTTLPRVTTTVFTTPRVTTLPAATISPSPVVTTTTLPAPPGIIGQAISFTSNNAGSGAYLILSLLFLFVVYKRRKKKKEKKVK